MCVCVCVCVRVCVCACACVCVRACACVCMLYSGSKAQESNLQTSSQVVGLALFSNHSGMGFPYEAVASYARPYVKGKLV